MSKIKKLDYLHAEIMETAQQLIILTSKIYESDEHVEIMVLSGLSNKLAKKISKLNCKIGQVFKL